MICNRLLRRPPLLPPLTPTPAAPMVGARLVLPGPHLDGENVYHMIGEGRYCLSHERCSCLHVGAYVDALAACCQRVLAAGRKRASKESVALALILPMHNPPPPHTQRRTV